MNAAHSHADDLEHFGPYVVLRPIRKGGMAQLALAFDTIAGAPVVLKRLPPNSEARRDQFLDEISLSQSISPHANLVRALDAGQIDGRDFLAVEWIDGPDLERLLEVAIGGKIDLPVPVAIASSIIWQVLQGLAHLHASGCIHRDVGAANIMVGYDGVARLIDYGIAKFEGKRHRTLVGDIVGTHGFIAPELDGTTSATEQSDLYGVGASLWFLLTGLRFYERGVDNNGKELLALQLKERGREDVPSALLTFLWRSLHRSPSTRYESALEAARAVAQSAALASTKTVAEFIGKLFAGEKQLAAEHLAEWKCEYGARPESAPAPSKSRRALYLLFGVLLVLGIAGVAAKQSRWRPATPIVRDSPPVLSPARSAVVPPTSPVLTAVRPTVPAAAAGPPSVAPAPPFTPLPSSALSGAAIRKRLTEAKDLAGRGRTQLARELYVKLEQDPSARPQALVGLAKLAYGDGDYARAVRLATSAARASAGPDALMVRGAAYLARRESDKAAADFDRVLALQPKNVDAAEGRKTAAQLKRNSP